MKNLFLLVLVIALVFYAYKKFGSSGTWQTDNDQPAAYRTLDMQFTLQGRDFSFKAVGEFPSQSVCETIQQKRASLIEEVQQWCSSTQGCRSASVSRCGSSIEERYKSMLGKNNADVYYMHAQSSNNQRVVMVFWGLSDAEGKIVCEQGRQDLLKKYASDEVSCVPA